MKKLGISLVLVAAVALGLAPAAFAQQEGGQTFQANLAPQNGSGASGTANLTLTGDQLTANIDSHGLAPNQPHAQHIHGMAQAISECPTLAFDQDGDGLVNTAEGVPAYGPVNTALTTTGDTSADSGLAVERFPVANANGNVSYSRTFALSGDVAANLGNFAIVQHGIDLNGNGTYDGAARSSLDPSLPLEATIPANCGKIVALGGVGGGGGGAAVMPATGGPSLLIPAGIALLFGTGIVGLGLANVRRRRLS